MTANECDVKRLAILGEIKAFDLPPLEVGTEAYVSLEESLKQHGCINPVVMHTLNGGSQRVNCFLGGSIKFVE